MDLEYHSPSPPKNRLRHVTGITCCFRSYRHEVLEQEDKPRTPCLPYSWLKSTAHELPEIGDKYRYMIARRIHKTLRHLHHHQQEADFRYDPMSYALNFEDDSRYNESPLRNFSRRLPASPPHQEEGLSEAEWVGPPSVVVPPREVVCRCN